MTDTDSKSPAKGSPSGRRGPAEHERRDQILQAAEDHFRHYGYGKTTVADLAKAIGLSTAYIYKFFDSKQAIGQAICAIVLGRLLDEGRRIVDERGPATDRMRKLFAALARLGIEQFFAERRLHDIAVTACGEKWPTIVSFEAGVVELLRELIQEGRENGEFERKTPIDEAALGIKLAMVSFLHPLVIEEHLDETEEGAMLIANLVLRSLAP